MNIVERTKNMLFVPKAEWPRIAAEPMTPQEIYTRWVLILGAIGPLAALVGWALSLGVPFALRIAVTSYVTVLLMTAVIALIVDFLAPHFGGSKDFVAALKLSAFSYTPAYLAGIFNLLGGAGTLLVLLVSLYAWYLFYLGVPVLRKASDDKALVFTIVIVVIGFVLGTLLSFASTRGGLTPGIM